MSLEEYEFGKVIAYISEEEWNKGDTLRITGIPENRPDLINRVDEGIWKNHWKEKAEELGVNYCHNEGWFLRDAKNNNWDASEVESIKTDVMGLIKPYNEAATKYNEQVAEPFREERESKLKEIF